MNKCCQSCGMPIKQDPKQGGKADGTKTDEYCSYCYHDGVFYQSDLAAAQIQTFLRKWVKVACVVVHS